MKHAHRFTALALLLAAPLSAQQSRPLIDIPPGAAPGDRASYVPPNPLPASRERVGAFTDGANVLDLGAADPAFLLLADVEERQWGRCSDGKEALRVGISRPAPFSFDDARVVETDLGEGLHMWTFAVRSPGSHGMRLRLTDLDRSEGARILVYGWGRNGTIAREVQPGRGDGAETWTLSVPGDIAFVEAVGERRPGVSVTEVAHFDRPPYGPDSGPSTEAGGFGQPAGDDLLSCHLDTNCQSVALPEVVAQSSTGQMNYLSGGKWFICTGTLINDQDGATSVPYFLTAFHCISTQSEVNSLEVVWDYRTNLCNGTVPDYFSLPRNCGEQLLATSNSSGTDMCFMRLDGVPPGQLFAGLSTADLPIFTFGVSHPDGSWQRKVNLTDEFSTGCILIDADDYHFTGIVSGMTQGGSSGSGLFNTAGQVMGQLRGKCGAIDGNLCTTQEDYSNFYGEMQESYWDFNQWIEMGGTIHVDATTVVPKLAQQGTPGSPFESVAQAYALAWDGARILIHGPANYDESLVLSKDITVLGTGGSVLVGL